LNFTNQHSLISRSYGERGGFGTGTTKTRPYVKEDCFHSPKFVSGGSSFSVILFLSTRSVDRVLGSFYGLSLPFPSKETVALLLSVSVRIVLSISLVRRRLLGTPVETVSL